MAKIKGDIARKGVKLAIAVAVLLVISLIATLVLPHVGNANSLAAEVSIDTSFEPAIKDLTLQVYLQDSSEDLYDLRIYNFDSREIIILGLTNENQTQINFAGSDLVISPFVTNQGPGKIETRLAANGPILAFQIKGHEKVFLQEIIPWPERMGLGPRQKILANADPSQISFAEIKDSLLVFPAGQHEVSKDIIIPPGYHLQIQAGCTLTFAKGADLISFSPVHAVGSEESNILFEGKEKGEGSFSLFNAEESRFSYCLFKNLTSLDEDGWKLTGAVSVHETPVTFDQCSFIGNLSEDGLNTIRSEINVTSCLFEDTFSDAFDADFCTGLIEDCEYRNSTNDAMDFSGCELEIRNCTVESAGDKGLSVGEKSVVNADGLIISSSTLGIASKDQSKVNVKNSRIRECNVALSAYQKKPEYGPANLNFEGTLEENKTDHLVQGKSILILNGVSIKSE